MGIVSFLPAIFGAASSVMSGIAKSQASRYDAKIQQMNAAIAEKRRRDALERGVIEEQQKRREVAQIAASREAALAAQGFNLSFGSAFNSLVDLETQGELDALAIRTNAEREAYDYSVQATSSRAQSLLSQSQSKYQLAGGLLSGAAAYVKDAPNLGGKDSNNSLLSNGKYIG